MTSGSAVARRRWRPEFTVFAALLGALVLAPLEIYPDFLMRAMCMALFASAFNLLIGYVGLLSFGHAMFLGCASYATAHAAKQWGAPPELAILFGVAIAAGLGAITGWLAIRRQGIYFAMITLGLAQMVYFLCVEAPVTHGEDGIQSVPRGHLFGIIDLNDTVSMYGFVLVVFVVGLAFIYRIIHSPFGAVLTAIRENEVRATSLGYNTNHYKLIAFVLSAALSGLAGGLKVLVTHTAALGDAEWTMSGEVVVMVLIGGLGRITGPAIGAFLVVALEQYLTSAQGWVTVVEGSVFVVFVLLFRQGIVGNLSTLFKLPL